VEGRLTPLHPLSFFQIYFFQEAVLRLVARYTLSSPPPPQHAHCPDIGLLLSVPLLIYMSPPMPWGRLLQAVNSNTLHRYPPLNVLYGSTSPLLPSPSRERRESLTWWFESNDPTRLFSSMPHVPFFRKNVEQSIAEWKFFFTPCTPKFLGCGCCHPLFVC